MSLLSTRLARGQHYELWLAIRDNRGNWITGASASAALRPRPAEDAEAEAEIVTYEHPRLAHLICLRFQAATTASLAEQMHLLGIDLSSGHAFDIREFVYTPNSRP